MAVIVSSANFNPAALQADDVYIVVTPPPSFVTGVPSDVAAIIGTASWGPLNVPVLLNTPADLASNFLGMGAPALTDPHDLATDVTIAFAQAQGGRGSLQIWGVRVSDGTDVAATNALKDTTPVTPLTGGTLTALYTGTGGNLVKCIITAGGATGTFSVTLIGPSGLAELYPNLPGTGAGVFWTNLANALLNGLNGIRGPSQIARLATPNASAIAPAVGTFTLTSGTDGRSTITTAQLTGSDTANPRTGIYSLRNVSPAVGVAHVAGLTDNTAYANIIAFADSEGITWNFTFASGTTTAGAITALQTLGISDSNAVFTKDWIYFFDSVNGITRLVPPLAFVTGKMAALRPDLSPGNKPVYGVVGTERFNTTTGVIQPYSNGEVGQLEAAGINVISNPNPGGNFFGMRMAVNSQALSVTGPIEYSRMTNWLARSFAAVMGTFVGQNQSTRPDDPVRAGVKAMMDGFLQILADALMIDSFQTICGLQNTNGSPQSGYNTPQTIAQHYLFALALVRYMSSIKYFVISLQGGTTVVTVQNSLNVSPA